MSKTPREEESVTEGRERGPHVGRGGTSGATRDSISSGKPIQKSMPSGSAISRRRNPPAVVPVMRRMTSPTSQPYVRMWYPCFVPGSQIGSWRASCVTIGSHASTSSRVNTPSTSGKPAWWLMTCRTVIASLPAAANSGQYVATARVGIELTALDQQVRAHRRDTFRRREHADDRVFGPGPTGRRIGDTAPQVHDRTTVAVDAHRGAHLTPLVEVRRERIEHRFELGLDPTTYHGRTPLITKAHTLRRASRDRRPRPAPAR